MNKTNKIRALTVSALFSVIIAGCSWLSIPSAVPFTMQTFAVFAALLVLGGKYGTLSVLVYIMLGAVGLPVFHGFSSGVGILLGATGGYILGFLLTGMLYWSITHMFGEKMPTKIAALVLGLMLCYAVGTAWFCFSCKVSVAGALTSCVFPFILPDLLKLALAAAVSGKIIKLSHLITK